MNIKEWNEVALKNTSGDMVHDILADWKKSINEYKDNSKNTNPTWQKEANIIAAQCWCDPTTEQKTFDIALAKVIANRIAAWMQTAAQNQRNADYYRDLVIKCGHFIGQASYIQDDGNLAKDVLCAKVPELVEALVKEMNETSL